MQRSLAGTVAPTDHDHRRPGAQPDLGVGGGVVDPCAVEISKAVDVEASVVGTVVRVPNESTTASSAAVTVGTRRLPSR